MSVELKLSRSNRIYRPLVKPYSLSLSLSLNMVHDFILQEALEGKIVIKTQSSISHYGIRLTVKGSVNLQVPSCFIVQKMAKICQLYAQNHSFPLS